VVVDACGGSVTLSQSPLAGTLTSVGVLSVPVTITAADAVGNTSSCVATLTVTQAGACQIPSGFVAIQPGTFQMGEIGVAEPVHSVTISYPFWMGAKEVTQAEYASLMGTNPSAFQGNGYRPVEQVTWFNARSYCAALTAQKAALGAVPSGYEYRLPTEAEWEYAYRAGTTTAYHSLPGHPDGTNDDQVANQIAWWGSCPGCGGNSGHQTYPVGRKPGNGFGLHDMSGNIYEFVNDWASAPYPSGPLVDPTGPATGTTRVLRGGSFADAQTNLRSSKRYWTPPNHISNRYGFRVVRNP
jgi:formylglycine-generating enzyme required for sulfatase activity